MVMRLKIVSSSQKNFKEITEHLIMRPSSRNITNNSFSIDGGKEGRNHSIFCFHCSHQTSFFSYFFFWDSKIHRFHHIKSFVILYCQLIPASISTKTLASKGRHLYYTQSILLKYRVFQPRGRFFYTYINENKIYKSSKMYEKIETDFFFVLYSFNISKCYYFKKNIVKIVY